MAEVTRLLIVEDDAPFASTLREAMRPRAEEVRVVSTIFEARAQIRDWKPNAVLLDVALPDGKATELLGDLCALQPLPHVIAISGAAVGEEGFLLRDGGVVAFISKPLALGQLEAIWHETLQKSPDLTLVARASVGKRPLKETEELIRAVMVREALVKSGGSRRGAAKLLKISRQLLQYILRKIFGRK